MRQRRPVREGSSRRGSVARPHAWHASHVRAVAIAIGVALAPAITLGASGQAAAASTAFVPPPYNGGQPSIEGRYAVEGVEPGGKVAPTGVATITRRAGDAYTMVEEIAGGTYPATCLRRGDLFACGWGRPGVIQNVVVYTPLDDALDGRWLASDRDGLGRERLVGGDVAAGGTWSIVEGAGPDGVGYGGTVVDQVAGEVHRLVGSTGGTMRFGFGLRDRDALVVGFDGTGSCGAVAYRIGAQGRTLVGRWVDPGRPTELGTETLRRP